MSGSPGFVIVPCRRELLDDWLALRRALWPHQTPDCHRSQIEDALRCPDRSVGYLAVAGEVGIGLVEAALRTDYVNGCTGSPVAFLEGIHVQPAWRRRGVARSLCRAVEAWATGLGCREFASDAATTNLDAQRAHQALGFEETERVVFYRKPLQAGRRRPGSL